MSSSCQEQVSVLRTKYENEIKKNNNLLKMNSNLMKENQLYQNCFVILKKWKFNSFVFINQTQISQNDNHEIGQHQNNEDSCIDIQEQGQEFVKCLIQDIQKKFALNTQRSRLHTQTQFIQNSEIVQSQQCQNCIRWKQLYIKQTKQTSRLQKTLDDSSLLNTQKQINVVKLKDDICKLLQDYLNLYRKQYKIDKQKDIQQINLINSEKQGNQIYFKINSTQTVRSSNKSKQHKQAKQKRSSNSGNKNKKITAFSKQKTSRNPKYQIDLTQQPKQSFDLNQNQNINNICLNQQLSTITHQLPEILSSYAEFSKNMEQQNNYLKEQLKQFNQILLIYREKQRNRILYN